MEERCNETQPAPRLVPQKKGSDQVQKDKHVNDMGWGVEHVLALDVQSQYWVSTQTKACQTQIE